MRDVEHKHVADVVEVPCGLIRPFSRQQRDTSKKEGIAELTESIRAKGQVQPALVKPLIGNAKYQYELVSGERRWRACAILERPLRVVVLSVDGTEEQYALSCVANNQKSLTPMEICNSLWVLYKSKEMQHVKKEERMAATARRYFGRGHQWAWGYTGLRRLDVRLQPLVKRNCPIGEFIPLKIAVRLAGLPAEVPGIQMRTWEEIISANPPMSVSKAQLYITEVKKKWAAKGKKSRGRPLARPSLKFGVYLEKAVKDMEPVLEMMGEEEFARQLLACDQCVRDEMEQNITGMIERLQIMRGLIHRAYRGALQGVV